MPEHQLAETWRNVFLDITKGDAPCAVLLSNGADSNAMLAALLRNGRKPAVVSFRRADVFSKDWRAARATARKHNLTFHDLPLPVSKQAVERDVRFAIGVGFRGKADIECGSALVKAIDTSILLGAKQIYSGLAVDKRFGLQKRIQMDARNGKGDDAEWLDEYRATKVVAKQVLILEEYAAARGVSFISAGTDERLIESVKGWSWNQLNKPHVKMPLRDAFPEMREWGTSNQHVNFNVGDSGIAEMYEALLDTDLNIHGWKSTVGIYNAMVKGTI